MENDSYINDAVIEDKLVEIWSSYPALYDVRSPDFKNRDKKEHALVAIETELGKTGKNRIFVFFQVKHITPLRGLRVPLP